MANPASELNGEALNFDFDRRLMLQFRGSVVTSDAGLLAYRERDDALGLTAMAGEKLADTRTGKNGRHALVGLLRQAVFGRPAGYEDVNDAERLRHDPAMRWIVGGEAASGCAASASHRTLDEASPCRRQGRMASWRTLSARRLHRHQHGEATRECRRLLQQARDLRTVDQRGQGRDPMDAAVVPYIRCQRRSAPASCARLQSRQLPAYAGDARADKGLVADEPPREADQDRREGREPRPLCRVPDGGTSGISEKSLCRHPAADRRTAAAAGPSQRNAFGCHAFDQNHGRRVS